jgi:hypothetical protein
MTAYVIVDIDVQDAGGYPEYSSARALDTSMPTQRWCSWKAGNLKIPSFFDGIIPAR